MLRLVKAKAKRKRCLFCPKDETLRCINGNFHKTTRKRHTMDEKDQWLYCPFCKEMLLEDNHDCETQLLLDAKICLETAARVIRLDEMKGSHALSDNLMAMVDRIKRKVCI